MVKTKRTNGKATCGFCGKKFKTMKKRFKHTKDYKENR